MLESCDVTPGQARNIGSGGSLISGTRLELLICVESCAGL